MTREEVENIKEELEKIKTKLTKVELQSPQRINARIPKDIKFPVGFVNELKDYSDRLIDCSQECEGTFKIKDGDIVDIYLTGIALMPRFKDGVKE